MRLIYPGDAGHVGWNLAYVRYCWIAERIPQALCERLELGRWVRQRLVRQPKTDKKLRKAQAAQSEH